MKVDYNAVLQANQQLHTRMADDYNDEPHFRSENIAAVEQKLIPILKSTDAKKLLDLGCGTGFMINIAKSHVAAIDGVDATAAMLEKVDTSGGATIRLFTEDTGSVDVETGAYDVVTAYSFLHHLYSRTPTLKTAAKALRKGGKIYIDLEPNYYFWKEINELDSNNAYDEVIAREVRMVTHIDEHVVEKFGLPPELMNNAEYGKNIQGGIQEEVLLEELSEAGFGDFDLTYNWFVGQGALINDPKFEEKERFQYAEVMDSMLQKALPVSRTLYKYLGVVATRL